jgi:dTDP-4-amino-4,6-dideoxygalactose transaminase
MTFHLMQVKLLDLTAQYLTIRREIRKAIDDVCDAQSLILGPGVERFEKELAGYCQTKHAIGVSSGTDAILCALMALGIKAGDEVICPSFTFFATAGCIARVGATPVFADIEPESFNISPAAIAAKITPKTRAIIPVHLFGQCARMEEINSVAAQHGVTVIEDAAQAIGAKRHGKAACSMSFAGCLSFYPTKNLGAFGDAGAICTNDDDFANTCKLLRVHGSAHTYHHKLIGGNFRIAAIQAAVLDVKLKYLDSWHEARRRNAAIYTQMFTGTRIKPPVIEEGNYSIYNQYVVRVPSRDAVKEKLAKAGIGSAVYYPLGLHMQECFRDLSIPPGSLPETERACAEVLALPIYPELKEEELRYVAKALIEAVG